MEYYRSRMGALIAAKQREYGDKFDASDLNPNFVNHFNHGDTRRVKVKFPWNDANGNPEIIWGYVSITTGWKPVFLLMRRRGQVGSSITLKENCQIIDYKDIK